MADVELDAQLLTPREEGLRRLLADIDLFSRHVVGMPLRPYQIEPARAILDSVFHRRGRTFTVMMSRQAGKNELSAQLEAYLLNLFQRTGGVIVKAAPTFRPQIVNSILRLERALENGLNRGRWSRQLGSMVQLGRARVSFYSGEPESHVVGATASLLLEIDEAQDFDEEKYLRDFRPMGATTNVTTVLYGTAWTADTLLERTRYENLRLEAADGERRDFRYPWHVVAEHNADYRAYVEAEMARMGPEHPLIRTQYLLDSIESAGRLFSDTQLAQLHGEHARLVSPVLRQPQGERSVHGEPVEPQGERDSTIYVAGIDVAGEDEEAEDAVLRSLKPRKDSTAVTICAVSWDRSVPLPPQWERLGEGSPDSRRLDHADGPTSFTVVGKGVAPSVSLSEPAIRIVQHYWWTGRKHRELFPQLVDLLKNVWRCRAVVVDATGVGAGVASFLVGALPGAARPFLFTAASKSALGYGLLSAVNGGRLKMYADASPESAEFWQEMELARTALHENQRLSFYVDPREGHDDLLMSAALAVEAAAGTQPRVARGQRIER